jgi:ATP-dependent helicase/nuclease subunit A
MAASQTKALGEALSKRVEFALADAATWSTRRCSPPACCSPSSPMRPIRSRSARHASHLRGAVGCGAGLGRASAPTFSAKGSELEQAITRAMRRACSMRC